VSGIDFSENEGSELSAQITANAYIYGSGDAAATPAATPPATATTPAPATTPPATATPPAGGTS